jgi:hypothetical protein
VVDELRNAEEPKQTNMLNLINKYNIKILNVTFEVNHLSSLYISAGIIPIKYQYDASHIACAAVYKLDYILSFNFKHINKPKTKTMTDLINTHEGYEKVLICIPMELLDNDE